MDRAILFRGKRLDNGEWVEGYVVTYPSGKTEIHKRCTEPPDILLVCEIDSETVCQYTGLTDRNSKKIFEGDIVRDIFSASVVGVVRYGQYRNTFNDDEHGGHAGFYVEWKEKQNLLRKDLVYWVKNSEFIGNIFDNPSLLEGGAG